jgi:hypothetical protein
MRSAALLDPLYRAMQERMKKSYVLHVDETPILLLRPRRTAQAWTFIGDSDHPYTLFDVTDGRDEIFPARFLQGFQGYVQADGYTGYNLIHGDGQRHVGCWAHVRRKFFESRGNEPDKANRALAMIRTLYAVEREILQQELTGQAVVDLRRTRAGPVHKTMRTWLEEEHRTSLPRSPYGEAVTYAWNQWPTLGRYLTDARLRIDNNEAERTIRPLALSRKNWLFIGGNGGLPMAGVFLSLCASAKRHGLNAWAYLRSVLTAMAGSPSTVTELLPDVWAEQHRSNPPA